MKEKLHKASTDLLLCMQKEVHAYGIYTLMKAFPGSLQCTILTRRLLFIYFYHSFGLLYTHSFNPSFIHSHHFQFYRVDNEDPMLSQYRTKEGLPIRQV